MLIQLLQQQSKTKLASFSFGTQFIIMVLNDTETKKDIFELPVIKQ